MNYDPLLVSMGYIWRVQGLPPDDNPSFKLGYELAARERQSFKPRRPRPQRHEPDVKGPEAPGR